MSEYTDGLSNQDSDIFDYAFQEGVVAYELGAHVDANPYDFSTEQSAHIGWFNGWTSRSAEFFEQFIEHPVDGC